MISFLPKTIANKGLLLYIVSLVVVSLAFFSFAMGILWVAFGIIGVVLFFVFSNKLTFEWQYISSKHFVKNLFGVSLMLRLVWVVFSYYFYLNQTGQPFEFGASDSIGYHETAVWLATESWTTVWDYFFGSGAGVSDAGYALYLTVMYRLIGPNVMAVRMLKVVYSSLMCVLMYRLTTRTINEKVGRMVGVFAMLMPNLIIYCGLHLKETEMLLIIVAFLERADCALRSKHFSVINILLAMLLAGSLFFFRTVLGAVAVFSFISAAVFSSERVVGKLRKVEVTLWVALAVVLLAGGTIWTEVESYWEGRGTNQETKRLEQTSRGNQWAQYATGTVMAPMVFVMPFSSMVDTGQGNQMIMHGGNYVRNFMGIFVLIALFVSLFVKKNWRDFALIGSFVIAYLGIISMSGFANSERFLLPGLPVLIIMWAYGISELNAKSYKWVKAWFVIVPIMEIGWAYFKIGSRGLLG